MSRTEWDATLTVPVSEGRDHVQGQADAAVTLVDSTNRVVFPPVGTLPAGFVHERTFPLVFFDSCEQIGPKSVLLRYIDRTRRAEE